MTSGSLTLLLGGARSGKSLVAEQRASASGLPVTYVATAVLRSDDPGHVARIAAHRDRRDPSWTTVECGAALVDAVQAHPEGLLLIDSLGTWVAAHRDFAVDVEGLCRALAQRPGPTVIVSEEVGLGVVPSSEVGGRFRDALGTVNVAVAAIADEAHLVVAGRLLRLDRP